MIYYSIWPNQFTTTCGKCPLLFYGHKNVNFVTSLPVPLIPKNYLKKNVKVGVLRKEIPPKPLNMQSFGHQPFISSQPYLYL